MPWVVSFSSLRPFGPDRDAPRRCWLDLDVEGGSCGFDVNGKSFGNAFAPLPQALQGVALFPAVAMRNAQLAVSFSELKFPKEGVFKKVVGQPLRGWRHDKCGVVTRLEKQFKLKKSRNFQYGSKKFHVAPAQ
jgi:hypothetical protein